MDREKRIQNRIFYVLDKIALELDQAPPGEAITYWTQDSIEHQLLSLQNNQLIPNVREEIQILNKLESEGVLKIESNYGEYE